MALLRSQGRLLVGKFADDYFPDLEFVDERASSAERFAAVARFREDVRRCRGNISRERADEFQTVSRWLGSATAARFSEKGYAVTGEAELKYLIGGALFLNRQRIAVATIWNPRPKGYFGERLLEAVQGTSDGRPGTRSLSFYTVDSNPIGEGQKMGYELFLIAR